MHGQVANNEQQKQVIVKVMGNLGNGKLPEDNIQFTLGLLPVPPCIYEVINSYVL